MIAIENHDTLNPKLFQNGRLLPEVRKKLLEIADAFVDELTLKDVDIEITDLLLIGSNVSYTYTKDSDLDLHIIANPNVLDCPEELGASLYSAYRSIFDNKLDIDFYGIPVELFVETSKTNTVSNGIYSVINDTWVKEPKHEEIPEIDKEEFDKAFEPWEVSYKVLKAKVKQDKLKNEKDVVQLITDIYDLRKTGLSTGGEYSIPNLIFKEFRHKGYLDDLKDMRNDLLSKRLSLEESCKADDIDEARKLIARTIHVSEVGDGVYMQENGRFFIYDVREQNADSACYKIRQLDIVDWVEKRSSGYDAVGYGRRPDKFYTIIGQLKDVD